MESEGEKITNGNGGHTVSLKRPRPSYRPPPSFQGCGSPNKPGGFFQPQHFPARSASRRVSPRLRARPVGEQPKIPAASVPRREAFPQPAAQAAGADAGRQAWPLSRSVARGSASYNKNRTESQPASPGQALALPKVQQLRDWGVGNPQSGPFLQNNLAILQQLGDLSPRSRRFSQETWPRSKLQKSPMWEQPSFCKRPPKEDNFSGCSRFLPEPHGFLQVQISRNARECRLKYIGFANSEAQPGHKISPLSRSFSEVQISKKPHAPLKS